MKVKVRRSARQTGIVILQDTRETNPILFTTDEEISGTRRETLNYGDYQALYPDGSKSKIVFERKALPDLWGTMTKGHSRFIDEMSRAKAAGSSLVLIVEAPFSRILVGFDRSKYPGTAMIKKLWTLFHAYRLPVIFCQNRQDMSAYIAWSFIAEKLHRERLAKT